MAHVHYINSNGDTVKGMNFRVWSLDIGSRPKMPQSKCLLRNITCTQKYLPFYFLLRGVHTAQCTKLEILAWNTKKNISNMGQSCNN